MRLDRQRRLPTYDFSQVSAYFVTIRVYQRECVLGDVVDDRVWLTETGQAVGQTWEALPAAMPWVIPDAYVVMPNHVHGVLLLTHQDNPQTSLEIVMRAFKSLSTLACNGQLGRTGGRFWAHGFEFHAIHSDSDLKRARQYLEDDPEHWADDDENPARYVEAS